MRDTIIAVIAAVFAALALFLTPAAAEAAPMPSRVATVSADDDPEGITWPKMAGCDARVIHVKDTGEVAVPGRSWMMLWGDIWRFDHCAGGDWVRSVTARGEAMESTACAEYIDSYKINLFPIGGFNPPIVEWECVEGKRVYRKTWYMNMWVSHGASDRCTKFDWMINRGWPFSNVTGTSPGKCLS